MCLLLAVCAVVVAITWQFARKRRAERYLTDNVAVGRQALNNGRFGEAAELLKQAAQAAEIIGRDSPQALAARALNREARVWNHLCVRTLDDFFAEHGPTGGAAPAQAFDREFASRTLVFDGLVEPHIDSANYSNEVLFGPRRPEDVNDLDGQPRDVEPQPRPDAKASTANAPDEANGPPKPHWTLAWLVSGPGYVVELATEELTVFDALPRDGPVRAIFGGVIDRLEPVAGQSGRWRLHLEPESCVLLTVPGPLEKYNWPDADAWRTVLHSQKELRDGPPAMQVEVEKP
ncbi:MAG: hypothetical protein AB7U73_00810 [Pirellulales bacterium]